MDVKELKCTRCFAPLSAPQGQIARCHYCGATLVIGAGNAAEPPSGYPGVIGGVAAPAQFLEASGQNKIAVIKVIRTFLGLGLREAKDLVESAPCALPSLSDPGTRESFRLELMRAGARVR